MFVHTGENGVLIQMENKNELVSAMTLIATNSKYVKYISNYFDKEIRCGILKA